MSMLSTVGELDVPAASDREQTMFGVSDGSANGRDLDANRVLALQGRPN